MSIDRRNFLSLMTFVPPAAVAAEKLVAREGGEVGLGRVAPPIVAGDKDRWIDRRDHAMYDVLRVPAGAYVPPMFPFFAAPLGSNSPGSWRFQTLADTNSYMPRFLPAPETQYVNRVMFLFSPTMHPEDRAVLASRYYWELRLSCKVVARAPVAKCAVLGHPTQLFKNFGHHSQKREGTVADQFCMNLRVPLAIVPLQHYAFDLIGEPFTAKGDMEFFVMLDGLHDFSIM